jgi:NADH-quinone oxidoreductase subunit N
MSFDAGQLATLAPLIAVVTGGVIVLMLEAFAGGKQRGYLMPVTLAVIAVALALEWVNWGSSAPQSVFSGLLVVDKLSVLADCIFLVAAALSAMLAEPFMREHHFEFGEFYALLLFATSGMMMLGSAADLLAVFLGIETMSISVYVLTGSWRRAPKSSEAAMKYYLTGAFTTAILLYGIALLYGAAGTTSLKAIAEKSGQLASVPIFLLGVMAVLVAFAFKVAAVPFHMWAPDAYEGAPTPVTAFMAAGVKAAAFVAFIRVFGGAFGRNDLEFGSSGWATILSVLAILTMTLGNLAALKQENVKRLLAYSSIAHAGYLLVGIVAIGVVGPEARGPVLFYLVAYTFTTIGAFGVVAWLGSRGDERLQLDDWSGLASRHPAAALAMTIFMLSLGGVPPTAGFLGKFYIFRVALERGQMTSLVIIAVLNSVVSIAYYLRVITAMYFREMLREPQPIKSAAINAALLIAALATMFFGVLPGPLVDATTKALAQ